MLRNCNLCNISTAWQSDKSVEVLPCKMVVRCEQNLNKIIRRPVFWLNLSRFWENLPCLTQSFSFLWTSLSLGTSLFWLSPVLLFEYPFDSVHSIFWASASGFSVSPSHFLNHFFRSLTWDFSSESFLLID